MATLLLVDDSPVARRAVARRLAAEGFDVLEEASAAGARAADATQLVCAVIDIELPDGSGVDLAAHLRACAPSLPVAFFTASGSAAVVASARALGQVFLKPDLEALVAWARSQLPPP